MRQPVLTGLAIHTGLTNFTFDKDKPFACCLICGAVYQTNRDRDSVTSSQLIDALAIRNDWRQRHSRMHTQKEHELLAMSGQWCTPEAAQKLAPFGIVP